MRNIRTAMNRGAFDFLTKPIDFADLEATVAKTLRHVAGLRDARARRAAAERAHAALARYFSPNLAAELAAETRALSLASQRRDVTAVFTDITNFTAVVETLEPAVLTDLLNGYFAGMTDIVFAHGGTITKIMGDALQVLFGAPDEQPDHAARAVACALALDAFAETYRARWRAEGIPLGRTRIGLHSGPALVGDFGGGRYFDYTAYGNTINTAARLEAANKALGTRICASAAVAERVPDFRGRPAGDLLLRGTSESLRAYEPVSQDELRVLGRGSLRRRLREARRRRTRRARGLCGAGGREPRRPARQLPPSPPPQRPKRHAGRPRLSKRRRVHARVDTADDLPLSPLTYRS